MKRIFAFLCLVLGSASAFAAGGSSFSFVGNAPTGIRPSMASVARVFDIDQTLWYSCGNWSSFASAVGLWSQGIGCSNLFGTPGSTDEFEVRAQDAITLAAGESYANGPGTTGVAAKILGSLTVLGTFSPQGNVQAAEGSTVAIGPGGLWDWNPPSGSSWSLSTGTGGTVGNLTTLSFAGTASNRAQMENTGAGTATIIDSNSAFNRSITCNHFLATGIGGTGYALQMLSTGAMTYNVADCTWVGSGAINLVPPPGLVVAQWNGFTVRNSTTTNNYLFRIAPSAPYTTQPIFLNSSFYFDNGSGTTKPGGTTSQGLQICGGQWGQLRQHSWNGAPPAGQSWDAVDNVGIIGVDTPLQTYITSGCGQNSSASNTTIRNSFFVSDVQNAVPVNVGTSNGDSIEGVMTFTRYNNAHQVSNQNFGAAILSLTDYSIGLAMSNDNYYGGSLGDSCACGGNFAVSHLFNLDLGGTSGSASPPASQSYTNITSVFGYSVQVCEATCATNGNVITAYANNLVYNPAPSAPPSLVYTGASAGLTSYAQFQGHWPFPGTYIDHNWGDKIPGNGDPGTTVTPSATASGQPLFNSHIGKYGVLTNTTGATNFVSFVPTSASTATSIVCPSACSASIQVGDSIQVQSQYSTSVAITAINTGTNTITLAAPGLNTAFTPGTTTIQVTPTWLAGAPSYGSVAGYGAGDVYGPSLLLDPTRGPCKWYDLKQNQGGGTPVTCWAPLTQTGNTNDTTLLGRMLVQASGYDYQGNALSGNAPCVIGGAFDPKCMPVAYIDWLAEGFTPMNPVGRGAGYATYGKDIGATTVRSYDPVVLSF